MKPQEITTDVLIEKYAKGNETCAEDIFKRVSKGIASAEKTEELRTYWEKKFFENMMNGAIGAGRIMSAAGSVNGAATLINCFAQPVGDSIRGFDEDGIPGIYEALSESAETMRRGGGVGYNFSLIRPKGAGVGTIGSRASGPCSYMDVFDSSCKTVESAGERRGAQMGILNINHPDIEEFITAKRTEGRWNNFNVSVFVTDEFMRAKDADEEIHLVHKAKPSAIMIEAGAYQLENGLWSYRRVMARNLWTKIMKSNYDFAEPGILFENKINDDNNLRYCEYITATNPCVTGDTVILTDKGYLRIDSLVDQNVQIWNGYEWSWVVPKVTGINQEIFDLEFSDGTKLSCTPYHKFILADGSRVEAKDLQFNSKLSKFNFPVIEGYLTGCLKTAYTQGFYSGDGQAGTNRIWLYNDKCNLVPYLALSAYSDQSSDTCKRLMASIDFNVKEKDFVPTIDYAISVRLTWLAGLIDSDGSVQDKTVTIWSVDRNFLNNIKLMLNTLGVSGTITIGREAGQRELPDGKGGHSLFNTQDCWRISISGSNISKLRDIGLVTYRVDISGITNRDASRLIQLTFKQKRHYLEGKVYCFNEEKNHSGIFNGIMTAQCAEQPLPPYGCCDLGPIILTKFVHNPFTVEAYFDMTAFTNAVTTQVRFLDNVLDVTVWPLTQQKIEADNKRRIGIGFTGLGNALAMLQIKYNSDDGIVQAKYIAEMMRDAAYIASINLAKEKGSFPLLNVDKYLEEGTFASRLPALIKEDIRTYGIRNSHLLSIAPTGTVSLAFADNASNGIEPPFSLAYTRKKRTSDGSTISYVVLDHAFRVYLSTILQSLAASIMIAVSTGEDIIKHEDKYFNLKDILPASLVTAMDMSPEEHGAMVKAVQPYIDTSISKTVNVPADCPYEDFIKIYDQAYAVGLKGISTYRPNSIIGSVLSVITKEEPKVEEGKQMECEISNDLFNDFIASRPVGKLPSITTKVEYLSSSYVEDSFYVGVSFLKEIKRPIEVFFTVCPNGVPQEWLDAYAINLSFLARGGLDVFCKALRTLRKVKSDKGQVRYSWHTKADGNKVPKYHNGEVACMAFAIQELLMGEGVIDELGYPVKQDVVKVGLIHTNKATVGVEETSTIIPGKQCTECGAHAVIRKDGCSFCTNCSVTGSCG